MEQDLRQCRNIRRFAKTVGTLLSNIERRNTYTCGQHIVMTYSE